MKKSDTHAFANSLLVFLLVTIGLGGSVGLGLVWMRHQISLAANSNRILVARIADVERHLAETKVLAAAEQDPDVLRQRNADLRLGLAPVSDAQVVRVNVDPVRALAERRSLDS